MNECIICKESPEDLFRVSAVFDCTCVNETVICDDCSKQLIKRGLFNCPICIKNNTINLLNNKCIGCYNRFEDNESLISLKNVYYCTCNYDFNTCLTCMLANDNCLLCENEKIELVERDDCVCASNYQGLFCRFQELRFVFPKCYIIKHAIIVIEIILIMLMTPFMILLLILIGTNDCESKSLCSYTIMTLSILFFTQVFVSYLIATCFYNCGIRNHYDEQINVSNYV